MGCTCEKMAGDTIGLSQTCIGHLWLFEDLPPADLEALSRDAARRQSDKGSVLFAQDDPANDMFLIKAGRIKLTKVLEDGGEITLDIRKAGDFVGENMFADEGAYPVSAICLEDTLTCGFSRAQFEKIVLAHPNIGLQVIKNLSKRINWLSSRVGSLALTSIEERLYQVLAGVAREHGRKSDKGLVIQFPLTHEDLSFLTGAHRVSITRAIKSLKSAGKIIHDDKRLILPALAGR